MGRKKILEKRLARLMAKKESLAARALASTDAAEVRGINAELEDLNAEIAETREEIDAITEEEKRAIDPGAVPMVDEKRATDPGAVPMVDEARPPEARTVGSFKLPEARADKDMFASIEYRQAFMRYAQAGVPIPAEFRDGAPANTDSLGATIPTTVLNEFINLIRVRYGNLYSKVRKMNVKGAVKIPISELQASFKWISESTVAPREDGGQIKDFVEFSYNMAEIRVSQTLLSSIVTLDLFEREIVSVMMIAYMKAMDEGIVKGTGNGQMLGILNDPRVTGQTGHIIEMSASDINDWTKWRKNFFAKLPLSYRDGEFIFTVGTVDAYLETMADNNNNPVFRQATGLEVNDGDAANPNGRFFGRAISLVEPDIVADFDTANNGDVVGIFWQPNEYAINTNMQFGMRRYFDEERNEWVNKMLTVVDGKVLNPRGFYIIKKKA